MKIELTEQQARAVAEVARVGLRVIDAGIGRGQQMTPGDKAAAHKAAEILDTAWQAAVGRRK